MNGSRLPHHPSQVVDLSSSIPFHFDGKPIRAHVGDTVASALYAAGHRIFSRSFKYHRPRGLLCMNGDCANCLMNVDGVPNVRTCTEGVQPGMRVRSQNSWPSLKHDVLSILDKMAPLLPVGFYYKSFVRPRFMWHIAQPIIRRIAGLGTVNLDTNPADQHQHQNQHCDIAVIGGGPAGMAAAIEAASTGHRVTLIDEGPSLGGHLRTDVGTHQEVQEHSGLAGYEIGAKLAEEVGKIANLNVLLDATVIGLYEGNLLGIAQKNRLIKLRSKSIIIATGCREVPIVFPGNDLPGVIMSTAVRKLMHFYGVRPGQKATVVTTNDRGYQFASELHDAGIQVVAVADSRAEPRGSNSATSQGIQVLVSHTIKEAKGTKRVNSAVVVDLKDGSERRFRCDLICIVGGFDPNISLLHQAGVELTHDHDLQETVPHEPAPPIYVAGDVTGIHDLSVAMLQGKVAGIDALQSLPVFDTQLVSNERDDSHGKKLEKRVQRYRDGLKVCPLLNGPMSDKKKSFVCYCEDVTEKDLHQAIEEGFDEMQTLKRYSTLSMGPCQGKMCLAASINICSRQTGRNVQDTGTTTSRPPLRPTMLGTLAGPSHMPIKYTPLHDKHLQLGAMMADVGPWKRPRSYTTPIEECRAVREHVGIIDVSTLGKIDVQGRDAPGLLDKVYTHIFSSLPVGRIRYGLLCSDNGTIIDDGTITRMAEDHYFITTTTGNVDLIEEWLKWWSAGTGWCVHINNVTSAYAAINVAGPKARDTLNKLTSIDLSSGAFRYMRSAAGEVAGVPCRLLRIGFVGETGWEIHFPAEFGEYMWDTLLEAGQEFDIAPFGVEAQRVLRLEKKHIIIGQDTDIVSNPLEAGLSWVVKLEKDDFIGKHGLEAVVERGLRDKLVGFVMEDSAVPEDGAPVVHDGRPVGKVTSSRFGRAVGRGFGLVWVPAELSEAGNQIQILVGGKPLNATVHTAPFYDPDGVRLNE